MDTQDMGEKFSTGNRYLLLLEDRASKFAFAYPLRTKDTESVAKTPLDLLLMWAFHAPYGAILGRSSRQQLYSTSAVGYRYPSISGRSTTPGRN